MGTENAAVQCLRSTQEGDEAMTVSRSETPLSAQEVFDNWSAYLRPVDREDFKAALIALAQSATERSASQAVLDAYTKCAEIARNVGNRPATCNEDFDAGWANAGEELELAIIAARDALKEKP
jgi:hypothetical protein